MHTRPLRRTARVALWGLAVVQVLHAVHLRRRRTLITPLPGPPGGAAGVGDRAGGVRVIAAEGARVSVTTRDAAAAEMEATGAQVVSLLPPGLDAERALSLLHWVDPTGLRDDPTCVTSWASEAVAVHPSVARRMGLGPDDESLERGAVVRRVAAANRHTPSTLLRLAPDMTAAPVSPLDRWREVEASTAYSRPYGHLAPALLGGKLAWLGALTAGVVVSPVAGLAALATWSAKPALVFGRAGTDGSSLAPRGLAAASLLRLPRAWIDHLAMVLPAQRESRALNQRLRSTPSLPLPPLEERFEPPHDACPWCGSPEVVALLPDQPDLFQHKPGSTHLDECTGCGHVFQNPPLSAQGLDYYYEHFYDGIGAEMAEMCWAGSTRIYDNRVAAIARVAEPRRWLDVGAGLGHFCATARRRWPDATFDALDMGDNVEEAQRRGWVDIAFRGMFPEMADGLLPPYDVVSMHHYLEHTPDPRRELRAVTKVLEPGGHLMIEVPDPECPWSRRLGRFWYQWSQPQHMHFVSCPNLVAELEQLGFEVVSIERGPASLRGDLQSAVILWAQSVSRNPAVPWLPPPSLADRIRRTIVVSAAAAAMPLARIVDDIKDGPLTGPHDIANAYRVVARRL